MAQKLLIRKEGKEGEGRTIDSGFGAGPKGEKEMELPSHRIRQEPDFAGLKQSNAPPVVGVRNRSKGSCDGRGGGHDCCRRSFRGGGTGSGDGTACCPSDRHDHRRNGCCRRGGCCHQDSDHLQILFGSPPQTQPILLVRKQATDTLRCMQSLVMAQARARAHRIRMVEPIHRRPNDPRFHQSYVRQFSTVTEKDWFMQEVDRSLEENIKIVEMDHGESRGISKGRNSYSIAQIERKDHNLSAYYCDVEDGNQQFTTAPSAFTDISSRGYDENFDDFSSETTKSKPQYLSAVSVPDATQASFENTLFPNYMSNTESSRAKARSNSTPKQRPDAYERQTSRRREPVEGRNIPRGAKMQRSSSHAGSALVGYQYPCSTKLDKSGMSLKGSECGSTSIVVTDTKYGRPQAAYEVRMY